MSRRIWEDWLREPSWWLALGLFGLVIYACARIPLPDLTPVDGSLPFAWQLVVPVSPQLAFPPDLILYFLQGTLLAILWPAIPLVQRLGAIDPLEELPIPGQIWQRV
ncbi:MAG: hypothetical protein ABI743_07130, partial [bacterium]